MGGEARDGKEGRLKRTLSDIFLARRSSTNREGGQLGHSLISAVTTSFLGCIAPLATEFERCACHVHACMCTAHGVHGVRMPCICRARAMYTRSDRLPSPTAHPRLARPPLTATRPPHAPRSGTAPHPSLASLYPTEPGRSVAYSAP